MSAISSLSKQARRYGNALGAVIGWLRSFGAAPPSTAAQSTGITWNAEPLTAATFNAVATTDRTWNSQPTTATSWNAE